MPLSPFPLPCGAAWPHASEVPGSLLRREVWGRLAEQPRASQS